ncbi:MAG: amino acid ABC transporter substrate-binding protein [Deltaproteobacteria bacterium]|nr:MAG: amino acid ABC transporter substrate-binding protein [Deltaproteobacteria bacterium]
MKNRLLLVVLASALAVSALPAGAGEPIKIGALYNLTGDMAPIDGPALKGVRLKAKLINQAGGLQGRMLEVVSVDTKTDLQDAAAGARDLLSQGVAAAVGYGDTDYVLAAAPAFQERGLPFVTSGATLPDLPRRVGNCLFMAAFGDDDQAAAIAAFSYNRLKARNAIIWTDRSMDFAKALAKFFRQAFSQAGGNITQEEFFSSTKDFPGLVAKFRAARLPVDLIFIAAGPEAAAVAVKGIRKAGITLPIAGGDSFDSDVLVSVPGIRLAQGLYFATHSFRGETRPEVRLFVEAYRKEYGHPPENAFAALGFDAMGMIAAAIRRSKSTSPASLCPALSQTMGYNGVTGKISYTRSSGVPAKPVAIIGVQQGLFKPLWSWPPKEGKNEP